MDTAVCTTWRARSVRPPANATRITDRTGSVKMPPATNCVATTDARNPKVPGVTATGLGAVVTGVPGVTGTGLGAVVTGALVATGPAGRPLPGRPNNCQALTTTAMATTTRSAQATGSRTRRTLSDACAVSDGTSSPS